MHKRTHAAVTNSTITIYEPTINAPLFFLQANHFVSPTGFGVCLRLHGGFYNISK